MLRALRRCAAHAGGRALQPSSTALAERDAAHVRGGGAAGFQGWAGSALVIIAVLLASDVFEPAGTAAVAASGALGGSSDLLTKPGGENEALAGTDDKPKKEAREVVTK